LFDNSRDGIFVTTREGEIVDVNPAWLRIFGMTRADLPQARVADLYADPADRDSLLQAVDEHGFVEDYPLEMRCKDGAPIFVLVSAAPWKDDHSDQRGIQGSVRDVTEQRRVERELAEQQVRMEEAVAQERGRLARDLHDSVTQSLYSIGLYANAAARALKLDKQTVGAEHVGQIIQLTLEAMVDMRSLIFELRPPLLSKVGLPTALETRLKAVEGRTGIAIEFHAQGDDGLSLGVQTELYRIAQEALSNIAKHSRAEHVLVDLSFEADRAALEIRDDGDGFDVESARRKNTMGLRSIAERAQKIDAVVSVTSTPGQGTVVRVEVPNA
jgi:PAS domain S-box-containing protein